MQLVEPKQVTVAVEAPSEAAASVEELLQGREIKRERLGAWSATAICGNDITSSCLYVSGIAAVYAGALAPVALLLAAGVLYLYKKIYTEVVEALPLDGGSTIACSIAPGNSMPFLPLLSPSCRTWPPR